MNKNIILKILYYATRAPSTHNSQPWLFKLKDNNISLYYNKKLKLPEADKNSRDLYISIGCMLENMKIAALKYGFDIIIDFNINDEDQHIAEISFKESTLSSSFNNNLFNYINKRINVRGEFIQEKIPINILNRIELISKEFINYNISLSLLNKKQNIKKIALLTEKAIKNIYSRSSFRLEMSKWMNSNLSNKKEGIPGYSLKMPLFVSVIIPLIIRYFNIGKFLGKLNFKSIKTAPLIIILSSSSDNEESWINIGRCAEKLMLFLQSIGYQTSIYVGSIEIGNLYKEVQELTGLNSGRPQFIFAVGHIPGKHRITPRHKLINKIII